MTVLDTMTCLLCGIGAPPAILSDRLRDDASGTHQVSRCSTCGHVQLHPLPADEADKEFYDADRQARAIIPEFDFEVWREKCREDTERRLGWLQRVRKAPARVLDIGSGYGFFVDACTAAGYRATGSDLSRQRVELARSNLRGEFACGLVDAAFVAGHRGRFDAVTVFHVLEHLPRPAEFLQRCRELLASAGVLLIEVPNLADALLAENGAYRGFYWQRAHLSYFDPARLELLLRRSGFDGFRVAGVQRYGLRNLLNWADAGKPQLEAAPPRRPSALVDNVEALYRSWREQALNCDTLVVEVHP